MENIFFYTFIVKLYHGLDLFTLKSHETFFFKVAHNQRQVNIVTTVFMVRHPQHDTHEALGH